MKASHKIGRLKIEVIGSPDRLFWEIKIVGPKEALRFQNQGCRKVALAKATILADLIRTHARADED